jgi:hypothetical protein
LVVGRRIELRPARAAARLRLHMNGTIAMGLPALCAAAAERNAAFKVVAFCCLPLAAAVEGLRSLDMGYSPDIS